MAPRKSQPKRRKPGTGQIRYKKGRALPYEAAFPLGRDRYRYDYFSARSEAEAHLDQLVKERDSKEEPRNIPAGSQRVETFLPLWLEIRRPHLKPKTFLDYKYMCELVSGEIGSYRMDQVRREQADALLVYFHDRGFQNVGQMRMVLRQAFGYALEEGYIKKNPFTKAKAPPVERRKGIALTRQQRAHLLATAATEDRMRRDDAIIPLCPLWHLYSRLGFRKGEGLALVWADIQMTDSGPTITIRYQLTNVGGKTEHGTPKGKRARTAPLPRDLYDLLMDHKKLIIARAAADPKWENHGLVFPDAHGRRLSVWYVHNRWKKLRERAGLPSNIIIHDLRHTADYLMETAGVPRSARMAIVGHTTAAMDRHYTDHADMEAMRAAVEKAS